MPKCLFERASAKFLGGTMYDDLPHNPATHIQLQLDEYPDKRLHRWDGAVGIRDATAQELADEDAAILDAEATTNVNGLTRKDRLIFEVLFDHESRIRVLASQPAITKNQFKNALIALYKTL